MSKMLRLGTAEAYSFSGNETITPCCHIPVMQKNPSNRPSPQDLQISALRDALDRASRAAGNAEAIALQARGECQHERRRYLYAAAELNRVMHELKLAREDNARLRTAIGDYYQERETL